MFRLTPALRAWATKRHGANLTDADLIKAIGSDILGGHLKTETLKSLQKEAAVPSVPSPRSVFSNKGVGSLNTKRAPVVTKAGQPVAFAGKAMHAPSEYDNAVIGLWMKARAGRHLDSAEENVLLNSFYAKGEWSGAFEGREYDEVPGELLKRAYERGTFVTKALLDDSVSGGLYMAPVAFDDAIVTYPLLHSQVAPFVDTVTIEARRIYTAAISNVTLNWGVAEGTAITPFNTASLVAPLETTIFPLVGAVEVGNDLMADSPVNIGAEVTKLFQEKMLQELDKVIVSGDGVTQPQGIASATGTVAVSSDNGVGGPPVVSDLEGLLFAVPKQYRDLPAMNLSYLMNDVTYRRLRTIAVGPGDQRRVLGMQEQDYSILGLPARIWSGLTNSTAMCLPLKKYRLYRRLGTDVRVVTEGKTLGLNNTTLMIFRARFGGRVLDGTCVAVMNDLQG